VARTPHDRKRHSGLPIAPAHSADGRQYPESAAYPSGVSIQHGEEPEAVAAHEELRLAIESTQIIGMKRSSPANQSVRFFLHERRGRLPVIPPRARPEPLEREVAASSRR
jgi:hypothetical protein